MDEVLVGARVAHEAKTVLHVDEAGQLRDGGRHELLQAVVAGKDLADLLHRAQAFVGRPDLGELLLRFPFGREQLAVRLGERVGEHAGQQRDEQERRQADGHGLVRPRGGEVTVGDGGVVDEDSRALQGPGRGVEAAAGGRGYVGGPGGQQEARRDDRPEVEDRHRADDSARVDDGGRHEDGVEGDHRHGDAAGVTATDEEQEGAVGDHEGRQDDEDRRGHGGRVEERERDRRDERGQPEDDPRRQDLVELSADFQTVASRRPCARLV